MTAGHITSMLYPTSHQCMILTPLVVIACAQAKEVVIFTGGVDDVVRAEYQTAAAIIDLRIIPDPGVQNRAASHCGQQSMRMYGYTYTCACNLCH
jgi:hypothetical protein